MHEVRGISDHGTHTVLETPRLRLRPLRMTDAPRIQALFPQWEIVRYMAAAIPWPYPEDGARHYLESVLPKNEVGEQHDWAITLKSEANDLLIGAIGLYPESKEDNRGFWLATAYQRRGIMKEAVWAVNDFAFDVLKLPFLILNNAEPNQASHRIKEISGATIVSIDEDVPCVGGRFRFVRWRLTCEAWEKARSYSNPKLP